MPRPTVIKRTKSKRKSKTPSLPFVPEALQAFIARRFVDLTAFALFFAGAFTMLSLASYNHTDPSWNSAASETTNDAATAQNVNIDNWMGEPGAFLADLFLQTIGLGAFLMASVLCIWGYRLYKRAPISAFPLRLIALLSIPILGAIAFAQIPSGGWLVHPYMGASAGTLLLQNIHDGADALPFNIGTFMHPVLITLIAAIACFAAFCYAACFTRKNLKSFAMRILGFMLGFTIMTFNLLRATKNWIAHYNDPDYDHEPVKLFTWPAMPALSLRRSDNDDDLEQVVKSPRKKQQSAPTISSSNKEDSPEDKTKASPNIPVVARPAKAENTNTAVSATTNQQRFALSENGEWLFPSLDLLEEIPEEDDSALLNEDALRKNAELLQNVLNDFKIEGEIASIHPGPVVTLYEFEPAPGTKSARIISLSDDIARSMSAISVRCAVVPGRNVIGIELPNKKRQFVYMREMLASRMFEKTSAALPLILGKDIGGQPILADLAKMPHLLVAGTTGSGKSVAVNTMILSLLYRLSPEKCRFIMIDPKMLELSVYDNIPHLLSPVVTEPGKAVVALKWTVAEMENRYRAMSKLGVRNIEGYNDRLREAKKKGETIMQKVQTGFNPETGEATYEDRPMDLTELPFIVVVVDEFADLMLVAGKDVENAIQRLAQMARAAGIHLIMATQRPSVDVITGVVKANFPTRISFQVTSKIDSRTILGDSGAEQLLGMGDMLYMAPGGRITRVHGPFVSDDEVEDVVKFLKAQGEPSYLTDVTEGGDFGDSEIMNAIFDSRGPGGSGDEKVDELYDQAVAVVAREGKVSTSFIQRHLQIGYNRAARIVEEMEKQGIISPANATGKRKILVSDWSEV